MYKNKDIPKTNIVPKKLNPHFGEAYSRPKTGIVNCVQFCNVDFEYLNTLLAEINENMRQFKPWGLGLTWKHECKSDFHCRGFTISLQSYFELQDLVLYWKMKNKKEGPKWDNLLPDVPNISQCKRRCFHYYSGYDQDRKKSDA